MNATPYLLIFLGAGTGGVFRHLSSLAVARYLGTVFPYGTLMVNITGAFILGLLVGLLASHGTDNTNLRLLLATGLLGGFTTFSAFSLETITLLERNQPALAIAYVLASVAGALLALVLGLKLGR
jgi:fluoride exporter